MSPEEIKLNYFFDQPNYKFKKEPEYLQYSEEDDCYSELKPTIGNQIDDTRQNATHQSESLQGDDYQIEDDVKQTKNPGSDDKRNGTNTTNDTDQIHYKFYGIVNDGDYFVETEFE